MHNLDLIGSLVIGGLLLLALVGFSAYYTTSAHSNNVSQIEQRNLTEFGRVLEYDFNKIGYRVPFGAPIVAMDSTLIRFRADLDNDGVVDSVSWVRSGTRPDLVLTRHTSLAPRANFRIRVKDFALMGYTPGGAATLSPSLVDAIEVKILLEKTVRLTENFDLAGGYWIRRLYPKNL